MNQFHLYTKTTLQGTYTPQQLNLAFVFQVNCPGCFLYGIPLMNELYQKYCSKIGFIGISTAFEDFEWNTEANTQLLLQKQLMVGETKKFFASKNISSYPHQLLFPVAFDHLLAPEVFLSKKNVKTVCSKIPGFKNRSSTEQLLIEQKIKAHYGGFPAIAQTFALNQLSGTPSFIIFDQQLNIVQSYFGHHSIQQFTQLFDTLLAG